MGTRTYLKPHSSWEAMERLGSQETSQLMNMTLWQNTALVLILRIRPATWQLSFANKICSISLQELVKQKLSQWQSTSSNRFVMELKPSIILLAMLILISNSRTFWLAKTINSNFVTLASHKMSMRELQRSMEQSLTWRQRLNSDPKEKHTWGSLLISFHSVSSYLSSPLELLHFQEHSQEIETLTSSLETRSASGKCTHQWRSMLQNKDLWTLNWLTYWPICFHLTLVPDLRAYRTSLSMLSSRNQRKFAKKLLNKNSRILLTPSEAQGKTPSP